MSTLRSVPVRRIVINYNNTQSNQQQQPASASPAATFAPSMTSRNRPATPPMFRALASAASAPALERSGSSTPKAGHLDQPGASAGAIQPNLAALAGQNSNNNSSAAPDLAQQQQQSSSSSSSVPWQSVQFQNQPAQQASAASVTSASASSPARSTTNQANTNGSASALVPPPSLNNINVDNFEQLHAIRGVLNSPRSLTACQDLQIHPTELVARPLNDFLAHGVPRSVALLRREHFEKQRQDKLHSVRKLRSSLPSLNENADVAVQDTAQQQTAASVAPRTTFSGGNGTARRVFTAPPPPTTTPASSATARPSSQPKGRGVSPVVVRSANAPLSRSATPLSRINTNNNNISSNAFARNNSASNGRSRSITTSTAAAAAAAAPFLHQLSNQESSPARDDCLRRAAEKNQHRQEIVNRAKMEQETKDLQNANKIAHDERKREVTMRKMLRDRLLESEKKRLELEDNLARAQRQRRLRDQELERSRVAALKRENEQVRYRDPYQVAQAKQIYASPQQRRTFSRSASANSVGGSRSASAM